jgi:hypothetical protein
LEILLLLFLDYYYYSENIYMLEIRERIPFGKKKVSRENRETIVKEERAKRQSKG